MGISSDGVLVFGFPVGGEDEAPDWLIDEEGETIDFDDLIAGPYEPGCDYKARRVLVDACPADLTLFCSYDYPMYLLTVRGTELRAARGDMVDVDSLDVPADKINAMKAWCVEKGIEWQEPKWRLVSMYG